jgi:hypothetical protein
MDAASHGAAGQVTRYEEEARRLAAVMAAAVPAMEAETARLAGVAGSVKRSMARIQDLITQLAAAKAAARAAAWQRAQAAALEEERAGRQAFLAAADARLTAQVRGSS